MSDGRSVLTSLDHVILAVRDLEVARFQYQRLLGLEPSWTGEHPQWGTANTLFRLDNTYIELLAPSGDGPLADMLLDWIDVRGEGMLGLAFGTDSAEACRQMFLERRLAPGEIDDGEGQESSTHAVRQWRRVTLPMDRTRGVLLFAIEHLSPVETLPRAANVGDADASVYALDHAVVQTLDAEATKSLYGEGLGLRLALDKSFPAWGARLMFFRVGGVTVEVASVLRAAAGDGAKPGNGHDHDEDEDEDATPTAEMVGQGAQGPSSDEDKLWGLSYRVGNADAARARVAAAGFDVSEVRPGRRPNTRVFTVRNNTCNIPTLMLELSPAA